MNGADTLTADADGAAIKAWGQALVHEVTHTTEGTMGNAALAAQLSSIMGDDALYAELSRRGYFKGNAEEVKAHLESILAKDAKGTETSSTASGPPSPEGKVSEELTEAEIEDLETFVSEGTAIMAEKILGDGHFIRRLVTEQGSVAEKILVKLTELKESLSRMTSKDAKSLHRAVVKAEGLYLKAVEEAGYRFEGGKFVGAEEEEKKAVKYSIKRPVFSEEDIQRNMKVVAEMEPVADIPAQKLEKTGKRPKELFAEYFDSLGNNIYSPIYGDIALSNSSVKSEIRHGITAEKIASIEAIPAIIENGQVIFHRSKSDSDVERLVICAPITIASQEYYMGVMLQRDTQNQRLYLHSVLSLETKEEANASSQADRVTNGALEDDNHLFMTSILQKAVDVKRNLKKSSVKDVVLQ